jgi:hypothetical protein
MAKVVFGNLKSGRKPRRAAVSEKRVRNGDGQFKTLRTVDAGSKTFGKDLQYVFGKNVAKARRENRLTIGSNDVAVPKR